MRLPCLHRQAVGEAADRWPDDSSDPVVDTLDRYAAGPLSPDPAALSRVESRLRAAFASANLEPADVRRAMRQGSGHGRRALVAACTTALVVVSTAGIVAAESGPGEPFYRTRLSVEAFFLPSAGSPGRIEADVERAQARLDEALRASSSANWSAETDAIGAYLDVVASMSMPQDPADRTLVQQRLAAQMTTLVGLSNGAQSQAREAARRAIDRLELLLSETAAPTSAPSGHDETPDSSSSGNPGSSGIGPKPSPGSGGSQEPGAGGNQPSGNGGQGGPQGPGSTDAGGQRSGSPAGG